MTQLLENKEKVQTVSADTHRYCLYARKSTEQDEMQALSIDSQIKEMKDLAEKEDLYIAEVKQESHSAKAAHQRPVFNQLLEEIKSGKFNAVLTWAPDRLSRNAGDLGAMVDLMDQDVLKVIQTHGQRFSDDPSEKFLLMIMGSQAKLENDNRSKNVKRGLRARCEQGLRPSCPPTGYLNHPNREKKCHVIVDPKRGSVIKQMFEKIAYEEWSGRDVYRWLKNDLDFTTKNDSHLTLSTIYRILRSTFYYGIFEYPEGSDNWYEGVHTPIISKELYEKVQVQLDGRIKTEGNYGKKDFAFTKLMKCGHCGSGITAERKTKSLKDGGENTYTYYRCGKSQNLDCDSQPLREYKLIKQAADLLDDIAIDKIGIQEKLKREIARFNAFQSGVLKNERQIDDEQVKTDMRNYAKYILREGSLIEKREILSCLEGDLVLDEQKIRLL